MKEDISKKIQENLLIIDIILMIYIIILFIFKSTLNDLIYPINTSFFMLITFFCIYLFGYRKNKRSKRKDRVNNTYITLSVLYLVILYLFGNATTFFKSDFNLFNSCCIVISIIFIEILRYIILNKCSKKTNQQYIITLLFMLFDLLIFSSLTPSYNWSFQYFFTMAIMTAIKNLLMSYTSSLYGYYPCIIYSLIVTALPLIAPLYPDLGNYLSLVFTIIYSSLILYTIHKISNRKEKEIADYKKGFLYYFERVTLAFTILIIFLVSGNFKYSLSAIASDSMYPEIKRGDAIILEKIDNKSIETLEKGMIIAFEENNQIITHRILSIDYENGTEYITTKGDNNATKDVTKKEKDDIIGIVKFKIPLIGYPSVEISEIKNKR